MERTVGIFAKYWEPGTVKTRLAKTIGIKAAAELYYEFLTATVDMVHRFRETAHARAANVRCLLGFTPPERRGEFERIARQLDLLPQSEGDLGKRMQNYFDAVLDPNFHTEKTAQPRQPSTRTETAELDGAASNSSAILIGSDTPHLPESMLEQAFENLKSCEVVIGPSTDGGYYLIGARRRTPPIFGGIPWSTEQVLEKTIQRLESNSISYSLLEPYSDVDDFADLRRLHTSLTERKVANDVLKRLKRRLSDVLAEFSLKESNSQSTDPNALRHPDREGRE